MGEYYDVEYVHVVEHTYIAKVKAISPQEAKQKMEDFDFESEEEIDLQGIEIHVKNVELADEQDD